MAALKLKRRTPSRKTAKRTSKKTSRKRSTKPRKFVPRIKKPIDRKIVKRRGGKKLALSGPVKIIGMKSYVKMTVSLSSSGVLRVKGLRGNGWKQYVVLVTKSMVRLSPKERRMTVSRWGSIVLSAAQFKKAKAFKQMLH